MSNKCVRSFTCAAIAGLMALSLSACGSVKLPTSTNGEEAASYPNIKTVSYVINQSTEQAVSYNYLYDEDGLLDTFTIEILDKTGEKLEGTATEENTTYCEYEYEKDENGYPVKITATDYEGNVTIAEIENTYKDGSLKSGKITLSQDDAGELSYTELFQHAEIYSGCTLTDENDVEYIFADNYLYCVKTDDSEETYNARHDYITDSRGTYEYDENGLTVKFTAASSEGKGQVTELEYEKTAENNEDCYSVDFDGGWAKYYVNSDHMVTFVETYSTENDCYISTCSYEYY